MPAVRKMGERRPGRKAGDKQHPVAVAGKLFLGSGKALGGHHPRHRTKAQHTLAIKTASTKHDAITDQHASHPNRKHPVNIGITKPGDDAAGHQGNVFRNGHTKTTDQQYDEYGEVAVSGKEIEKELQDIHVRLTS